MSAGDGGRIMLGPVGQMGNPMKRTGVAFAALVSALALSAPASARVVDWSIDGLGVSGHGTFSIVPDHSPPDPDPLCGTAGHNPCRSDPAGAWAITGVSGVITDANAGVADAAITGLIPINPAPERDPVFDPLVPSSLSFYDYDPANNGDFTYNNLFFPNGSPIDCAFPFAGTFVDVFGAAFTLAGGYVADLWGDGDFPVPGGGTQTYGFRLEQGTQELDNQFAGINGVAAAPEPAAWMLLLAGFSGLGLVLRRRRTGMAVA